KRPYAPLAYDTSCIRRRRPRATSPALFASAERVLKDRDCEEFSFSWRAPFETILAPQYKILIYYASVSPMTAKLSIVATPIGNLEDITLRALRVLKEADVIYCEDTRVTMKLLAHYDIHTPLKRLDANVEATKSQEVIERLEKGEKIAYVSDAGTPTISDPGYRLIAA